MPDSVTKTKIDYFWLFCDELSYFVPIIFALKSTGFNSYMDFNKNLSDYFFKKTFERALNDD